MLNEKRNETKQYFNLQHYSFKPKYVISFPFVLKLNPSH